jgi:hypothetical protein
MGETCSTHGTDGNMKGINHFEDLDIVVGVILKRMMWIGFIWLRIVSSGGLF